MSQVRSISTIQNSIISAIQNNPTLAPLLTSTSSVAYWNLMTYIIAASQAIEEGLMNNYQTNIEAQIGTAPPCTPQWIQQQAFDFQYSSTNPQIIQLNNVTLAPEWPTVNTSYRIITRCSVTQSYLNHVQIKVATGSTPGPLTSDQLSALQSYFNYIKPCGIIYDCISLPADEIYCAINCTFLGSYTGTIVNSLNTAYLNYLANIPFNGLFRLSDLEVSLKAVPGVVDIEFSNVNIRNYSNPFPGGSPAGPFNIVDNYTQQTISYSPLSGYFIDEMTSGYSFTDSLTLLPI